MKHNWTNEFKKPGSAYRGKPFWAWNGKLEEDELRRQIQIMHQMGLGGFFMHSRTGLATPYLSDKWHSMISACVDEAKKKGMEAWLYDEDRWPSGAAGGLVTKNPKYARVFLHMEQMQNPKSLHWTKNTIAVFTAIISGNKITGLKPLSRGKGVKGLASGDSLLIFSVEREPKSTWYNGYTYLDTLSHEAVKKFITTTHESYRKNAGRHFGKTIPGIFTVEPNYGRCFSDPKSTSTAWTHHLPRVFKARYGYDIVHHLPELYFDSDEDKVSLARYHYYDCITFLFVDAFARQIGQWCAKNNLLHTGHVLSEDTLQGQTEVVGSGMRFYEHMQAPGIDLLTERAREYNTAKQASSVARQFGAKWRLTETYGCTGWDFSFAGHKALGDWQAALGINLRCQHLSWYTMEGEAKRDYPASIFFQSPWWEAYSKIEDYFARIHVAMTRGEEVRDLLVIHPIESMWTKCRMGWTNDDNIYAYDRSFALLRDSLLMEHIDFDYGDEYIISRHGTARKTGKGPSFSVGKADYKAVLVPPLVTIRKTSLDLLRKFRAHGGLVVFAGAPPDYVDGVKSNDAHEFAGLCVRVPERGKALISALQPVCRRVSITDEHGIEIPSALYLLREDKHEFYLFLCNTGHTRKQIRKGINCLRKKRRDVRVNDRKEFFPHVYIRGFESCQGRPLELDPNSGDIISADAQHCNGHWEIKTSFPKLGSRLFLIPKQKQKTTITKRKEFRETSKHPIMQKRWLISLSEVNNAVLDRPAYRIGSGKWMGAEDILRIDSAVRDKAGVPRRGKIMTQPWAESGLKWKQKIPLSLSYSFRINTMPKGDLFLAIEQPARYRVKINGQELNTGSEREWWVDISLRKIPLDAKMLKRGLNKIIISCDYDKSHPGLETVYLLGDFGVRISKNLSISITEMPSRLRMGDWCRQGLPFYSGSIAYSCSINPKLKPGQRLFLEVPEYKGTGVNVSVNGRSAGIIAWEPNELDITEHLRKTSNELRIEILGHRRNSHGPLHHRLKHPEWTGPAQFVTRANDWKDTYQLVPCGLTKEPCLSVRRAE